MGINRSHNFSQSLLNCRGIYFKNYDVYEIFPHHFISEAQANHLRIAKENLLQNEVIILLDFAKNYSFVVQDAVQNFHWENSQATLDPFVIYFKSPDGHLTHLSICVISDCLEHE